MNGSHVGFCLVIAVMATSCDEVGLLVDAGEDDGTLADAADAGTLDADAVGSDSTDPEWDDARPDPPSELNPDYSATIMGRYWVSPNPIVFPVSDSVGIQILDTHLGSEGLIVDDISIEGSPDITIPGYGPGGLEFPVEYDAIDGCNGGGLGVFGLRYESSGSPPVDSYLVVHTSDPTSPTFRVPIVFDHTGALAHCTYRMSPEWIQRLWMSPNPVRLDVLPAGESRTQEICIMTPSDLAPFIKRVVVEGPGLAITGAREFDGVRDWVPIPMPVEDYSLMVDGLRIDLRYTSVSGEDVDGIVSVVFLGTCGYEMKLQAPVIVR